MAWTIQPHLFVPEARLSARSRDGFLSSPGIGRGIMNIYNDLLLEIEAQEIKKELKLERRKALERMRAEYRKKYCIEFSRFGNPTVWGLAKFIKKRGLPDLYKLIAQAMTLADEWENNPPKWKGYEIDDLEERLNPIFEWLRENPAPDGTRRHSRLLKNIGFFFALKGMGDPEVMREARKLLAHTPDKKPQEILAWTQWARNRLKEGEKVIVNIEEMNEWIEEV